MHILLAGNGNMATAIAAACKKRDILVSNFDPKFVKSDPHPIKPVAIHVGSGRQLIPLIDLCEKHEIPIIQATTSMKNPMPRGRKVVIIAAPNLSLSMIRFTAAFPAFAEAIRAGMEIRVVESHQKKKADKSATARTIVGALGLREAVIEAIRNESVQLALGVPHEHLGGHAYHDFIFTGNGVEIRVSTRITGRNGYAEGALLLAGGLAGQETTMKNGVYELKDVMSLFPTLG